MEGEYTREPCPMRILDDAGGGFTLGLIGGSLYHSVLGMRYAPSGVGKRLLNGFTAVRTASPKTAGGFAVWAGTFASCECALMGIRGTQDAWNPILSGATTGAILAARQGTGGMARAALIGGILLACIEGISLMMGRLYAPVFEHQPPPPPPPGFEQQGRSEFTEFD